MQGNPNQVLGQQKVYQNTWLNQFLLFQGGVSWYWEADSFCFSGVAWQGGNAIYYTDALFVDNSLDVFA